MEKDGVIFKVDQPTDWCAIMVVVPKPDDKNRIYVDYSKQNYNIRRENLSLPVISSMQNQDFIKSKKLRKAIVDLIHYSNREIIL
ncbi:hypothetical protein MAR_037708 [Mya arenaria]|uniref:Uncharacterized protein n=1 Tax=Mya arenaria TaxID=6604 RepID=A0ABY7FSB1_MYAAR|nr:hypothetical protein MAR_037708 [Mya arenaria]